MAYRIIKGEYHIHYPDNPRQGPEPDGDTLKFKPDNPALVNMLDRNGSAPRFNRRGMINIRFEGIDALETHFSNAHQNLLWAEAARDHLLSIVGFQNVQFFADKPNKVSAVDNHPRRGYVLAKDIDPHGRIIAFVFVGDPVGLDGSEQFLVPADLDNSTNLDLLRNGLVYPTFYTSLPRDLRTHMAQVARVAQDNQTGLWRQAQVDSGTPIDNMNVLEGLVIWPKLFRRLVRYFGEGFVGLADFDSWLRQDPVHRDDTLLLPAPLDGELSNMHDLYTIDINNVMTINFPYEEIIIAPDGQLPVNPINNPNNTVVPAGQNLRIIGALVNPIGPEVGFETVTIINISPNDVDLNGWRITDKANPSGGINLNHTLSAGRTFNIPLNGRVRLGNRGDEIMLYDNNNALIHKVAYTKNQAQQEGWTIVF